MKSLSILVTVAILSLCVYACTKDELFQHDAAPLNLVKNGPAEFSVNQQMGNLLFAYQAIQPSGQPIQSTLTIYGVNNSDKALTRISFTLDPGETAYKLIQHERVIEIAKKSATTLKRLDMDDLTKKFESFGKSILAHSDVDNSSPMVQSIFFHNAILNTVNRSKVSNKECGLYPTQRLLC